MASKTTAKGKASASPSQKPKKADLSKDAFITTLEEYLSLIDPPRSNNVNLADQTATVTKSSNSRSNRKQARAAKAAADSAKKIDSGEDQLRKQVLEQTMVDMLSKRYPKTSTYSNNSKNIDGLNFKDPQPIDFGRLVESKEKVEKPVIITNTSMPKTGFKVHKVYLMPPRKEFKLHVKSPKSLETSEFDDLELGAHEELTITVCANPRKDLGIHLSWLLIVAEQLSKDSTKPTINLKSLSKVQNLLILARPLMMVVASSELSSFTFDVFTKPYIPEAFRAVNTAPAMLIRGVPPPETNYLHYRSLWIPPPVLPEQNIGSLLMQLPVVQPLIPPPEVLHQMKLPKLEPSTFLAYFDTLLRMELGAQVKRVEGFGMYSVPINVASHGMYAFAVPGVVEGRPNLQVGDAIRIRRLLTFDGREYEGYIYSIKRRISMVYVFLPTLQTEPGEVFNIQFVFNDLQSRMSLRGLLHLNRLLTSNPSGSVRKLLFPEPEDGMWNVGGSMELARTSLEFFDGGLNWAQMKAVQAIVDQKHGDVPFLIWGPPGTGKTKTCIESIRQILTKDPHARILACAPSNSAADTIARRLKKFLSPAEMFCLNSSQRQFAEVPHELMAYTFTATDPKTQISYFELPPMSAFLQFRVVVCTCFDAGMLMSAGLSNDECCGRFEEHWRVLGERYPFFYREPPELRYFWTHLFIDEAGQADEAQTAVALAVTCCSQVYPASGGSVKIILSGDHMQLGPLLQSDFARSNGLAISYFERIISRPIYRDHPESRNAPSTNQKLMEKNLKEDGKGGESMILGDCVAPFVNLVRNYRSHPAMLMVPSYISYNDTLIPFAPQSITHSLLGLSILPNPEIPIVFFGIEGVDDRVLDDGASWWNAEEAMKVAEVVDYLVKEGKVQLSDFGVMAAFREQAKKIRDILRAKKYAAVNVGTVEDYQGMERNVILLSCVRSRKRFIQDDLKSNIGLIKSPARLNVAMTRAKSLLVVIGNPHCLAVDPLWQAYLSFYVRNNCYVGCSLPLSILEATTNTPSSNTAITTTDSTETSTSATTATLASISALEKARNESQRLMQTPSSRWLGNATSAESSLDWSHELMDLITDIEIADEEDPENDGEEEVEEETERE
ncbi:hypothetical protein HDV05_004330 [Chytridiales sp. JEL 0842]|nr:hypothetical protein HDV05_004330 [Chytridiales sp. JEL 0842]